MRSSTSSIIFESDCCGLQVSLPLLILHGECDKVTDPSVSKALYEMASSSDKKLNIYKDGFHALLEGEPDETIIRVFDDIIAWLDEHSKQANPIWSNYDYSFPQKISKGNSPYYLFLIYKKNAGGLMLHKRQFDYCTGASWFVSYSNNLVPFTVVVKQLFDYSLWLSKRKKKKGIYTFNSFKASFTPSQYAWERKTKNWVTLEGNLFMF